MTPAICMAIPDTLLYGQIDRFVWASRHVLFFFHFQIQTHPIGTHLIVTTMVMML